MGTSTARKGRRITSAATGAAIAAAIVVPSLFIVSPANAAELDYSGEFTNVTVDDSLVGTDGTYVTTRSTIVLGWDFAVPEGTKAGDTWKVTLSDGYRPNFTSALSVKTPEGVQIASVTYDGNNDSVTITFTEGVEGLIDVTGRVAIPISGDGQSNDPGAHVSTIEDGTVAPGSVLNPLTLSVGGTTIDTGKEYGYPKVNITTGSIFRAVLTNPDAGQARLYPTGIANVSDQDRDVTMTFTPASGNWHFDTSYPESLLFTSVQTGTGEPVEVTDPRSPLFGKPSPWPDTRWDGEGYEVVSFTEDELVIKVSDVKAGEAVRAQLGNIGIPDGAADETYTVNVVVDSPGSTFTGVERPSSTTLPAGSAGGQGETTEPVAEPDVSTTDHATPVTEDLLANDSVTNEDYPLDPSSLLFVTQDDSGKLVTVSELVTEEGTYTVGEDGQATFTPAEGFSGETTPVTYQVADSRGTTDMATWTITVAEAPVLVPPTSTPDSATTEQGVPVEIPVLDNDELGQEGSSWESVELVGADEDGVLVTDEGTFTVGDDNVVTFTPNEDFSGEVPTVEYTATDSEGQETTSTIDVTVTETPAPEVVAPDANPDLAVTEKDTPVDIDVLKNDERASDGAELSDVKLKDADGEFVDEVVTEEGTFTVNDDDTVTFTPAEGFVGETPAQTYQATDSEGRTVISNIIVTVKDAVDPSDPSDGGGEDPVVVDPDANPDLAVTDKGESVVIDVLKNDELASDGAEFTDVKLVDKDGELVDEVTVWEGTFVVNDDNTVTFTPADDYVGEVPAQSYQLTDEEGRTAVSNIIVTVKDVAGPVDPTDPTDPTDPSDGGGEDPSDGGGEDPTDPTDPSDGGGEDPTPTDPSDGGGEQPTDPADPSDGGGDEDPKPSDGADGEKPAPGGTDDDGSNKPGASAHTGAAGSGAQGLMAWLSGIAAAAVAAVIGADRLRQRREAKNEQ